MAAIDELISKIDDPALRTRIAEEVARMNKQKKFGLVFEEHLPEAVRLYDMPVKRGCKVEVKSGNDHAAYSVLSVKDGVAECIKRGETEKQSFKVDELVCISEFGEPIYPYLKPVDTVCNAPDSDLWHTLIEADNYHALQLLEYLYAGKVDCIYIDPPYNTGARDWKYNNDYVDGNDSYRHSKWLSMMEKRLKLAKKLLNPKDSVLIVTIDEKEYLHLGCLLEEMFPEANLQMVSSVINRHGSTRFSEFTRVNEYLFFVRIGASSIGKKKSELEGEPIHWHPLKRSGTSLGNFRSGRPLLFYPIYVNIETGKLEKIGEPLPIEQHPGEEEKIEGCVAVFPIRSDGKEGCWALMPETAREMYEKHYFRVGKIKPTAKQKCEFTYLQSGTLKGIEDNTIIVEGFNEKDGSIIAHFQTSKVKWEVNQWDKPSHDASEYGTNLIASILGNRFSYPKALYAVKDCLNFCSCVAEKKDAIVVDFFAGSGTTLHAVNLLNAEDGGHRRCIMVTNNEVSDAESKELSAKGFKPGDEEWEKLGIARYVTWPRTVCSIEGHDINDNPLKGNYLGSDIPMADGFKVNAAFFKLSFLDKDAVSIGRRFKELLPVLWMKAGAAGPCPKCKEERPDMLVLPENKMAVLLNESYYMDFIEALEKHPEIKTVFFGTDSESSYQEMIIGLEGRETFRLYRDYLDHFRIHTVRR